MNKNLGFISNMVKKQLKYIACTFYFIKESLFYFLKLEMVIGNILDKFLPPNLYTLVWSESFEGQKLGWVGSLFNTKCC